MAPMKTILFCLGLLLSFSTAASISIVSDLDDTIKITNSGEEIDGAINAVFTTNVFTGMPEFLNAARDYSSELHVLSASPLLLRPNITGLLSKKRIAFKSLILKNALMGESKFDYKVRELKKIFEKSSDDFILLGDDVGQDPEAYGHIQKLYPNRVLAIYIHVIKNRSTPAGEKYWTSFDLFLKEFVAGRMNPGWVEKSIELLLQERSFSMIIPAFAHCPKSKTAFDWHLSTMFAQDAVPLTNKLLSSCQARSGILARE